MIYFSGNTDVLGVSLLIYKNLGRLILMKVRKVSIATKLILIVMVLFLIMDIVLGFVTYTSASKMVINQIKNTGQSVASCVAAEVDGNILLSVQPGEETSDEYMSQSILLTEFLESSGCEHRGGTE